MGLSLLSMPLLLALAAPMNAQAQSGMPLMSSVDPTSGRIGDVMTVQGANLGQDTVAELYLTDGNADMKVVILEQTSTSIRFRIPTAAKPGRFSLMVLTKGTNPKLIEQPVKIVIEAESRLDRRPPAGSQPDTGN